MSRPLTLLLSAHALKTWGTRIEAAVPAGSLALLTAEDALAADGPCDADIAFMTREVTGRSSNDNPTPELLADHKATVERCLAFGRFLWLGMDKSDFPDYTSGCSLVQ